MRNYRINIWPESISRSVCYLWRVVSSRPNRQVHPRWPTYRLPRAPAATSKCLAHCTFADLMFVKFPARCHNRTKTRHGGGAHLLHADIDDGHLTCRRNVCVRYDRQWMTNAFDEMTQWTDSSCTTWTNCSNMREWIMSCHHGIARYLTGWDRVEPVRPKAKS